MRDKSLIVGLMSGTSADGVDACVAALALRPGRRRPSLEHEIIHWETRPYPPALRRAILSAATVGDVCRLNFAVAEAFAAAAARAIRNSRVAKRAVRAISSHGQTLFHAPDARPIARLGAQSTLQVGDISVIAARTGITTVGDFRTKDVALGGQGAPLVPFADYLLTDAKGAVWLNIGGIANITIVPQGALIRDVTAFDTGPGNTLIDRVVRERTGGRMKCDAGGRLALAGRVDEARLARMLSYGYFRRRPPKSTGPEEFGEAFLKRYGLPRSLEDACATLAALTADSVAAAISRACLGARVSRVIAAGGGIYNRAIMRRIAANLGGLFVVDSSVVGVPPDAREAFAFAVLGLAALEGIPNNVPSATGASRAAVLGKVARPD